MTMYRSLLLRATRRRKPYVPVYYMSYGKHLIATPNQINVKHLGFFFLGGGVGFGITNGDAQGLLLVLY